MPTQQPGQAGPNSRSAHGDTPNGLIAIENAAGLSFLERVVPTIYFAVAGSLEDSCQKYQAAFNGNQLRQGDTNLASIVNAKVPFRPGS